MISCTRWKLEPGGCLQVRLVLIKHSSLPDDNTLYIVKICFLCGGAPGWLAGRRRAGGFWARAGTAARSKLPVLSWLPAYQPDCAIADLIAGITVGLTVIPQVDAVTLARVT